jgi:hypothetical protein
MIQQYVRIVVIIGMLAVMCGTVSAAMGIGAENPNPSAGASYPVCTAPCECISMNEAAQRWGAEGYETCSKSVCGESANAMTQYYCIHQIGGSPGSSSPTKGSSLLIGGTTTAPTAKATTAQTAAVQQTVNVPAQTQVQTLANTAPPTPLQTPYPIQTKTPVGIATIIAAIGVVLLAVVGMRRK